MPGNRTLVWSDLSQRDMRKIWRHTSREVAEDLAGKILRDIADAANRLLTKPFPGRGRSELRKGLRSLLAPPHTIFFRIDGGEVRIVRVLHQRRNMAAIFKGVARKS